MKLDIMCTLIPFRHTQATFFMLGSLSVHVWAVILQKLMQSTGIRCQARDKLRLHSRNFHAAKSSHLRKNLAFRTRKKQFYWIHGHHWATDIARARRFAP
ncbi:hypothetical protein SCHPADRAFT_611710 [Schizopora paradoxa]|uniref:Uncharacterized protein n=1 Tax=Schizopora paradoxa TaxID=27342 RepID=A0A0H2RU63_9AGAM|nr:hypothetical protein SCHPADRAFT_611710 [Schizopora paradoxa]